VNQVDTDRDGLGDVMEQTLGFDPGLADSDADGFSDGLEMRARSDPMDPRANPFSLVADPTQAAGGYAAPGN
jgi:hypothetical protein